MHGKVRRLRRDADAGEQGNKWHKGINIQLDLHEDAGRHLKRAEEKISRVLLAVPSALAREALLEGKQIRLDDFELMGLKAFPAVEDAISEMGVVSTSVDRDARD